MAISVVARILITPREHFQLPAVMQPFSVEQRLTQDSSTGNATINVQFNPDSNEDYQRYVCINHIYLLNSATTGNTYVSGTALQWERAPVRAMGLTNLVEVAASGTAFVGESNEWYSLGRSRKGTVAQLSFTTINTNNVIQDLFMTGIISEEPILSPEYLRV